jgi:hypothetical protein
MLDPVPPLEQNTRDQMRQHVEQFVREQPSVRVRRNRRLRRIAGIGASVAILGGAGTAMATELIGNAPVTDHNTARCYAKISTDFGPDFPGATMAAAQPSNGDGHDVVAPIRACAAAWRAGAIQYPHPLINPPPAKEFPVPHLVGCVLPNGTAAVFPGPNGTCQQLGLPTALPG